MPSFIEPVENHYRHFLGAPKAVWTVQVPVHPAGSIRILEYQNVPCEGAVTLATLGLCDLPLHMFRQEFVFLCYEQYLSDDLGLLIAVVGNMNSAANHPLPHGSVLPPAGPLLEYTSLEALYVGTLMYFDTDEEQFDVLELGSDMSVLLSWLIPIHRSEAEWIEEHGYKAFEDLIVNQDPDLMDLNRPPLV